MTLDKLKTGESAVIKAVGGEGALRLRFLDMGLIPKTKVKMLKRAPMGDPLDIVPFWRRHSSSRNFRLFD